MRKHILNLVFFQLYETVDRRVVKLFGAKFSWRRERTGLQYFDGFPNFGDMLSVDLFKFFNKSIENPNCIMLAIGSLLGGFLLSKKIKKNNTPVIVYGTGFIKDKTEKDIFAHPLTVYACRGYKTLERLKNAENVVVKENVVLGDPGLLVSKMYNVKDIKKKYKLGIIPHYTDRNSNLLNNIKVENSVVLNICEEPEVLVPKIAECEYIISSAMHGLIAADSLGIPNIRMTLGDGLVGGDYKFNDYYSVFGIDKHECINLSERDFTDNDIPYIKINYKVDANKVAEIQQKLIDVFPF